MVPRPAFLQIDRFPYDIVSGPGEAGIQYLRRWTPDSQGDHLGRSKHNSNGFQGHARVAGT